MIMIITIIMMIILIMIFKIIIFIIYVIMLTFRYFSSSLHRWPASSPTESETFVFFSLFSLPQVAIPWRWWWFWRLMTMIVMIMVVFKIDDGDDDIKWWWWKCQAALCLCSCWQSQQAATFPCIQKRLENLNHHHRHCNRHHNHHHLYLHHRHHQTQEELVITGGTWHYKTPNLLQNIIKGNDKDLIKSNMWYKV